MMKTILVLDVGNTNVKVASATSEGLGPSMVLPTLHEDTSDGWGMKFRELAAHLGLAPEDVSEFAVSSVVPPLDPLIRAAARRFFDCDTRFVPANLPLPLENRYERPAEVGADRLVTAFAARSLYKERTLISIDFGTATTFDCVQDNAYLGGLICPGVLSSARALSVRTAKLPQISLEVESDTIEVGRSTAHSLNQGFLHGFAAMTEGVAERLKARLDPEALVVATGGFARRIAPVCRVLDDVRPDLLLEGLRLAVFK